ncbi:hypothetical protein ACOSQ4_010285 [Xanthoceras sorbifolium]
MFHGWLSVLEVLIQRKVAGGASCTFCHRHNESIMHATWGCSELKAVRKDCGVAFDIHFNYMHSQNEFLLSCFSLLKQDELDLLLLVLWQNWFRRNKFVHDNFNMAPIDIAPWSRFFLSEFQAASVPSNSSRFSLRAVRSPVTWVRPPIGFFKLNSDTSVKSSLKAVGLGIIIRDTLGQVVLSGTTRLMNAVSIEFAEALTIQFGLSLACDAGIGPFFVESDCLSIVVAKICQAQGQVRVRLKSPFTCRTKVQSHQMTQLRADVNHSTWPEA